MTWEETIIQIRKDPSFAKLVEEAYFDEDLELNIARFTKSDEFQHTVRLLKEYAPQASSLLDVGSGNGISAVAFAQMGYQVQAVEPDPSKTVGAGAITLLKDKLALDNLEIHQAMAEEIAYPSHTFDVVYVRQAMHHAAHLDVFIAECVRVLKPNGILLTIRDHVIYDAQDKKWFLESHPLHRFYGGENAFTPSEYKAAFAKAGARVLKELKFYDSVINYFPITEAMLEERIESHRHSLKARFRRKLGIFGNIPGLFTLYLNSKNIEIIPDEIQVPGRMYSYIVTKL